MSLAAGLQLMVGARGGEVEHQGFYPGYDLSKLEITEPTLYYVDKNYVDPARIDWDAMFDAGLDAVERRVPSILFARAPGGRTLAVQIGDFRTAVDITPATDMPSLQEQLRVVADLLAEHLRPEDVPVDGVLQEEPLAEVEYALVNGMLSTLDPHTVLLEPDDAREMDLENQGEFGGLGITIEIAESVGQLVVTCPLDKAPAARAGVRSKDRVVRIDGESTLNMTLDEAISRLRGVVGEPVVLTVLHDGEDEAVEVRVVRELIPARPVESQLLDGDVGWIRISGFHEKVEHDLVAALSALHRKAGGDLRGLVLDLRGNPGGFLNQAVRVADTFLDGGEIVSTVNGRGERTEPPETANRAAEPSYPIVVLVDANSASASEIVAGALRYNERAVIVGERTFGKGSVQNLHAFYDDSKLKLTISRYLTPGERSIQARGIPADIELVASFVPAGAEPIRLFERENVRREADLDHALEATLASSDEAPYRVRYLAPPLEETCDPLPELDRDPELKFARDLLTGVGTAWRRPDVLASAAPIVASYGRSWNLELERAMSARGIDWADGPGWPTSGPPPELEARVTSDLRAGEEGRLVVELTNRTDRPLWRVAALARGTDLVDGQELLFGRIPAGGTARAEVPVRIPAGWPAQSAPATLVVRDAGPVDLWTGPFDVAVEAGALPAFATTWTLTDADGDGLPEVGEELALEVRVRNVGEGPARSPYARLLNRSGRAVELEGTASFEPASPSGAPGLLPGEIATGVLRFTATAAAEGGGPLTVLLDVGDAEAVDRSAWLRRAVSRESGLAEPILLTLGGALPGRPEEDSRRSPEIRITRLPALRAEGGRVTLSGMVSDDGGIDDVMVFSGADKVFLEKGSGELHSLPFTADIELVPGENIVSVVARDVDGFVATRTVVTWSGAAELARATPAE